MYHNLMRFQVFFLFCGCGCVLMLLEKLVEYTIPEKPNSRLQKYCLTPTGQNHE